MPDGKEGYAFYRNNLSVIASQCHCPGCGTQQPQHFACVLLAAAQQRLPYKGSWRAQARLRGCTKVRLYLFRSICTSAPPLTGWAV